MGAETIFVVGTSEGGVSALQSLASGLPKDFPGTVLVVLHIGAHQSNLPWLLNQRGPLPAFHPKDGDPIRAGHVYVAPPDHHMVVESANIRLTKGPRENWVRPAVDPLFRSAARAYGTAVVGVILTGGLNDGTAGLYEIKQRGGVAVVQDPDDAANPSMPPSALNHVAVDHCLPLAAMPQLFTRLAGRVRAAPAEREAKEMTSEFLEEQPVAVTCPDCGGALRRTELGTLTQFRRHIGHVYTAEVMLAAQFVALERSLEMALRSLGERAELCRQMADKTKDLGVEESRREAAMQEARDQAVQLEEILMREWIRPDLQHTEGPRRSPASELFPPSARLTHTQKGRD